MCKTTNRHKGVLSHFPLPLWCASSHPHPHSHSHSKASHIHTTPSLLPRQWANLYSLNLEIHHCLWQNSKEVFSCLMLALSLHTVISFMAHEEKHTHTHTKKDIHKHKLPQKDAHCFCVILSPPCQERRGKTPFNFRKQINSRVGDQLSDWEQAERLWQQSCFSPRSTL